MREPYIRASILTPKEYIGQIMELCQERRGEHAGMHYLSAERVQLQLRPAAVGDRARLLRPAEVAHARLRVARLRADRAAAVATWSSSTSCSAATRSTRCSMVVHRDKAYEFGKTLTEKLRKKIPRQQYDVPIQAAVGAKIIARETVKAFRKDVTAKCYGGDISRKRKLLEHQKEGKKRMKQVGRIEVPQDAFLAVLELGDDAAGERARARSTGRSPTPSGARRCASTRTRSGRPSPLHLDLEAARAAGPRRRRRAADVRGRLRVAAVPARRSSTPRSGWTSRAWSTARRSSPGGRSSSPATRSPPRSRSPSSTERGGMGFYVFESRSDNQDGERVCTGPGPAS